MSRPAKNRPLNPRRIGVIATHTFTQLVRMKVFYFLAIFAVIVLGSNLFDIQGIGNPDVQGMDVLRVIRSWSLGTMTLFSVVIGVVATALLLPKDVEDRTLYTILAKPVPRLDYLVGKLAGVLMLIFFSLLLMDLLMTGVLTVRTHMVVAEQMQRVASWPQAEKDALRAEILLQGPTWSLHGATLAVFMRSAVIASTALLLSTFSTSTLFTTISCFLVYFIGNFQADARDMYLSGSDGIGPGAKAAGLAVAVVFPDFQLFNVIDGVIEGAVLPLASLGTLAGITIFYVVLHTFVSWLIFAGKEF
jgi:ABC-2 type transport system permease protein